jgi:hypothetical protein
MYVPITLFMLYAISIADEFLPQIFLVIKDSGPNL